MAGFNNDVVFAQQGMRIGDITISTNEVASIQFDEGGSDVALLIHNNSVDPASTSHLKIQAETDTWTELTQSSTQSWIIGIDNSDGNRFKINEGPPGITPSTGTNIFRVDPQGLTGVFSITNLAVQKDNAGNLIQLQALQTDSSNSSSSARLVARTQQTDGDAYTFFDITNPGSPGTKSWKIGSNGSVNGNLEFYSNVNAAVPLLGGSLNMSIEGSGEVTFPRTPAFLATVGGVAQANVTGAGAAYTVNFTNVIFNQGTDFDGTSTFTAPVTGRYLFDSTVLLEGLDAAATTTNLTIVTSNGGSTPFNQNGANGRFGVNNRIAVGGSAIKDMDAGDTAIVNVLVAGMGGNTVDIPASLTSQTYFSGMLLC